MKGKQRKDHRRAVSCLLLILLLCGGCSSSTLVSNTAPLFPYSVLNPRFIWHLAMEEAQTWRSNAYVANVQVSYAVRDGEGGFNRVDFNVLSPTESTEALWVTCSETECAGHITEKAPYHDIFGSVPIALNDFSLNAKEAFEISIEQGGRNYISGIDTNKVSAFVKLIRYYPLNTGNVVWRVSFSDYFSRRFLDVFIDANTGEVLEIRE